MKNKVSAYKWCMTSQRMRVLIILNFYSCFIFSQFNPEDFTQYTTKEGFSDDNVTCITQDHFGFLWVGTTHGLNRFDGSNVESYLHENAKASILSEEILGLYWKDSTELIVSTKRGLFILNIETLHHQNILIPPGPIGQSSRVNNIRNVLMDETGHFYVITRTGFYDFNKDWELVFRYDDYDEANGEYSGGFGTIAAWLDKKNILLGGRTGILPVLNYG